MDMTLTAEQDALREEARGVAAQLAPDAARWDDEERFPESSLTTMADSGLLGATVPVEHGGGGMGVFEACLVLEELARGCLASAVVAQMFLNGPPRAIATLGTDEQRSRFLPAVARGEAYWAVAMTEPEAGSDGTALSSTLVPDGDGYRLSGRKWAITGGARSEWFLVFCRLAGSVGARGIGAVVVHRDAEGFASPVVEPKMGMRGVAEAELAFHDVAIASDDVVIVPDASSSRGAAVLVRQFNPERCGNAAMCIGVAQAALDAATDHARTRTQFGRPIVEFQGLSWKLADMAVQLESARLMTWRAAASDEDGFPELRATAMAKLHAGEMAQRVTNEAIQVHGHRGYLRTYPLERHFRDVRGLSLGGGTAEIMRNIIAAEVTGVRTSQRRAPAAGA